MHYIFPKQLINLYIERDCNIMKNKKYQSQRLLVPFHPI